MTPMVADIVDQVCREHALNVDQVVGRCRFAPFVRARHEVWLRLRELGWSLPAIAAEFGVDHTTVMAGSRKAAERIGRPIVRARVRIVDLGPTERTGS